MTDKAGTLRDRIDAEFIAMAVGSESQWPDDYTRAAIALCREEFARVAKEFHLKRYSAHGTIADAIMQHEVER